LLVLILVIVFLAPMASVEKEHSGLPPGNGCERHAS
jgi:hypothetical protein